MKAIKMKQPKKPKNSFAGQLRKLAEESTKNIWLDNYVKTQIFSKLETAAKEGKNTFIIAFTPFKIEELNKIGANIDQLKQAVEKENIAVTEMRGMNDFETQDDLNLRFHW